MLIFDLLLGIGLGIIYVEVLFRVCKWGMFLTLLTYPARVAIFALLMATFLLESSALEAITLLGGFFVGLVAHTLFRGFIKGGSPEFS